MNSSTQQRRHPPTHLFTLRLWAEAVDEGQDEVRMQVKHVLSGETRYFRDWGRLWTYLLTKVQEEKRDGEG